jgi:hypothetical protein
MRKYFHGLQWVYAQKWYSWIIFLAYYGISTHTHTRTHSGTGFAFLLTVNKYFFSSITSPASSVLFFINYYFFYFDWIKMKSQSILNLHFSNK